MADDYTANTSTTGTVAVGGSVTGNLETVGDNDWFKVQLTAGVTYQFDLRGTGDDKLEDPALWGILDSNGDYIQDTVDDDGSGASLLAARVIFTPTASGTYYIDAGGSPKSEIREYFPEFTTGTYTLAVSIVDDFAAGTGTTGTVAVGGSATGNIGTLEDRDWFRVELVAGKTYRFDMEGTATSKGTLADPFIHGIFDSNGDKLPGFHDNDSGTGKNALTKITPTESGTYYVDASTANSAGNIGTYTLSATLTDDFTGNTATVGTVTADDPATGEVNSAGSGDNDWFRIDLVAGRTYRFDLEGSPTGAGSLSNPRLGGIYDSDGNFIAGTSDDDGGEGYNSRVIFTPTENGTYFVGASAHGSSTGTYKLSVTVPDDFADDTSTTGTVAVDGSTTGDIYLSGDEDWFAVELVAGTTYQIDVEGSPAGDGALTNPYLGGIHDSDGDLIEGTTDDDSGPGYNSRAIFTPTEGGTYYVEASGHGSSTGTYKLSVAGGSDVAAGTGTTGTILVDDSATSEIHAAGDEDWFAIELEAGTTYRFDLEGSGAGALADPYLRGIHDSDGELIANTTDDNSGTEKNSRVSFTPTESGTYYVSAGASESGTGTYTLSVRAFDKFSAGTDTTGTVAVGGSATGRINITDDSTVDADWFAVQLEAEKTYRFDLEGRSTGKGTLYDPVIQGIHDSDGNLIGNSGNDDGGTGKNSQKIFTPTESGTYYVSAGTWVNNLGTYTLSVAGDDFAAGTGTTGTVTVSNVDKVGVPDTGEIESAGDRDWFAVELVAGTTYRFDLKAPATSALDPYLHGIHDSNGAVVEDTTDDNGGKDGTDSRVIFTPTASGTYYVSAGDAGDGTGAYGLQATNDALTNDTTTTGRVTVDGSATGGIESASDVDWFAVELEAETTYRIDLEGTPTSKGTLSDPYLNGIHDSGGNLIAGTSDDDSGTGYNARESFTPAASGTYYVSAGTSSGTGTYTLGVRIADDFTVGTGTTGTVAVGGSVTGRIGVVDDSTGDQDWFAVELVAGKTYQVDLEGSETEAGTLANPRLHGIYDSDGEIVEGTTDDDGGEGNNSRVSFAPTASGTYYVSAGGNGGKGTYTLTVRDTDDDFLASTRTAGTATVGGSATGGIDYAKDKDWFAVELEAGKTYQVDLEGSETGAGTLSDPWLRGIHDSNGNLFFYTSDDDSGTGNNSRVSFTPTASGTYYIAAGVDGSGTGTYALSVRDTDDDFLASTRTAGTVAVDGSATGEIESAGDEDWFAVELEAGGTYQFDLEGSPTSKGTLTDPWLRGIRDSDGNVISDTTADDGGTGNNSRVSLTPTASGTYYVAAGADESGTGTYTLSVTLTDDFAADTSTTGTVTVSSVDKAGVPDTGRIESAGDRDWFAVELVAGTAYRFDLEASGTEALADPHLYGIHDSDGTLIEGTSDDDGGAGDNSRVIFTPTASGTHYVAAGGAGDGTGAYGLSVTTDVLTHDTTTSGRVTVGGTATGEIDSAGDADWFAVELEADTTYRIDLEGSPTGKGTLTDPHLNGIHNSSGTLVSGTSDDDSGTGNNSRESFTPAASGTYYVSAGTSSGTGTYTVSVRVPDEFTDDTDTTGTVAVGGSATGRISLVDDPTGDEDWLAVQLEAGKTYQFDLEGSPTGKGTLDDPELGGIYDSDGDIVEGTTDDDGGEGNNSRVSFTPTASGTWYVSAKADGSGTGTYTLSVTLTDDFLASTSTTGTVTVSNVDKAGVPDTGKIEGAGDRDWFAVELVAGTTYRIDLEAAGTDALADPYLHGIHDSDGNLIEGTADDDGGAGDNSRVIFTPTTSGTHYVSAGDSGDGTGAYGLSVTTDVLTHDTTTSGRVTIDGTATSGIDSAGDADWFAVELEAGTTYRIDLEGSPTSKGTLADPYLNGIYDSGGNLIAGTSDDDGGTGNNARKSFTPTESGTYYVAAGTSSGTGTYTLSVRYPDDFAADTGTTGTVAVDGSVTGRISLSDDSTGDADWFAVQLEAGKTYQFDLEGSPTEAGTLANPRLRGIYDTDADLMPDTTDDDGGEGNNARVTFTPTAGGTYYVAAGGNESMGTYALSVRHADDDFLASHRTAGAVTVETIDFIGVRNTGKVDHAGDRDWFAVELVGGTSYRFELEGTWTSDALADPYLHGIHDASGALVAGTTDDNGGTEDTNSRVIFTPSESGTYYVAAGGAGDGTGIYGLSVMTDVLTHDTSTTGTVTVGGSATGEIDSGHDADWFAVQLTAGTTYRIDLEGSPTSMGTLSDPYLNGIYNSNGEFIARTFNHDGGTGDNARTTFTPSETATYYISAGTDGSATNIGTYTVSVEEVL